MALDVRADRVGRVVSAAGGWAPRARYLPIAEHGLIGDLHTVALVGTDGTIDWYCCPRFDSPSVFAAILDADRGGLFRISPDCDGWSSKQLYLPDTNVLITRFLMPDGVGEVQDFMPPAANERGGASPPHDPPGARRARAGAFPRRCRPALRLRAGQSRRHAHVARRALPLFRVDTGALDTLPARDRRGSRRPCAHRAPGRRDGRLRARPRRAGRDAGAVLRGRCRRRVRRHGRVLAALAEPLALRRTVA